MPKNRKRNAQLIHLNPGKGFLKIRVARRYFLRPVAIFTTKMQFLTKTCKLECCLQKIKASFFGFSTWKPGYQREPALALDQEHDPIWVRLQALECPTPKDLDLEFGTRCLTLFCFICAKVRAKLAHVFSINLRVPICLSPFPKGEQFTRNFDVQAWGFRHQHLAPHLHRVHVT